MLRNRSKKTDTMEYKLIMRFSFIISENNSVLIAGHCDNTLTVICILQIFSLLICRVCKMRLWKFITICHLFLFLFAKYEIHFTSVKSIKLLIFSVITIYLWLTCWVYFIQLQVRLCTWLIAKLCFIYL